MQGNVISFKIDHTKLLPGIYLHEVKEINGHYITTYDIRFKRPNHGIYLTPTQAHTIEHVLATFFTDYFKDKLYFGPMGCLTGFYLVLDGKHDLKELAKAMPKAQRFFKKLIKEDCVPAKTPYRCGNYRMLDINEGYEAWWNFYSSRRKWGTEYPIIPDDFVDDETQYRHHY